MGVYVDTALADVFPTLARDGVAYLDSSATSQTPRSVLDAMADYYERHRASVHRGTYPLAVEATDLYEHGRDRAAELVGGDPRTTILVRNATEAINLVAYSWGRARLRPGDIVVVTDMEHHSNLVPWQLACETTGAQLRYVPIDEDGRLVLSELDALLGTGDVRMVAVAHISNVLGTINPVADIVRSAHSAGALVLVDGAQAVPQMPVDIAALGSDFYAWTAHKAYGPTGIGVLHGRRELLEAMPPFMAGGHMISRVERDGSSWAPVPEKFEAGTPAIAEAIGLAAAVDFMDSIGTDAIRAHELELTAYALDALAEVPGITLHGPREADHRGALVSFALEGVHPHDVSEILGREGICIRAGHHCAQVLMRCLGVGATSRASFAVHNTATDVDRLVAGLYEVAKVFA
jgi:cysteine desulfurase / selenocysteine lyase